MSSRVVLVVALASTAGLLPACGDDAPDCSGIECGDGGIPADGGIPTDGGLRTDGGLPTDGGSGDAGALDGGTPLDAAPTLDGGPVECRPERVDFPMGGDLTPGTLCDDVFACADDAADAARIIAAAPHFVCEEGPGGIGRCGSWTCNYRNPGGPSTLDEAEIQEICSLTALEPTPELVCVVYL